MEPSITQKLHEAARGECLDRRSAALMHDAAELLEAIFEKFPGAKALVPLKYQDFPWKGTEP